MNESSDTTVRRDFSKHYQLIYSIYTLLKLFLIVGLLVFIEKCFTILNVYLILYTATEGYELLFMILLLAHRYCFQMTGSLFLIAIGQISYEW